MAEHTPGPWEVRETFQPGEEHEYPFWIARQAHPTFVADVLEEGNARLIAAAPDLLAALEEIANNKHEDDKDAWMECWDEIRDVARAAIAKAKGEADAGRS